MRVLLAALHPPGGRLQYGGVQSWITTVARRLSLMGCEARYWGPEWALPRERFQLGILAHRLQTKYAIGLCEKAVFVSHGVVPEEAPDEGGLTIFTSEEVCKHWKADGPIMRQPIDLEFWTPDSKTRKQTLVFYSYRAPDTFGLDSLAKRLGLKFVWLRDVKEEEARPHLQTAALVCASGRAALEAMACNTPTIICDWRDYNGRPLVSPNIEKARAYNYSGRGGVRPSDIDMKQLARETMALQRPREYIKTHHDSAIIVRDLLDTCLHS